MKKLKAYPVWWINITDRNDLTATIKRFNRPIQRIKLNELPDRHFDRFTRTLNNMIEVVCISDHISLHYYPVGDEEEVSFSS
jgi:hypothetical protein